MDDRNRSICGNAKVGSSVLTHGVIEVGIAEVHNGELSLIRCRLGVFNDFDGCPFLGADVRYSGGEAARVPCPS